MTDVINEFKHIEMPQMLSLGANMFQSLPEIIEKLSLGKSCLLITDTFVFDKYAKEVEQILLDSGFKEIQLSTIEDSTLVEVDKQLNLLNEIKAEFVIGLGGGKPIDVAKLTSYKANQRFISIPTIASHDGIASSRASLKGINERHSIQARPPIAVVADTSILDKSPYRFTCAGCGDVLAKKTSIKDWLLAHRLKNEMISPTSIALANMTVELVSKNADLIKNQSDGYSRIVMNSLIGSSLAMCVAGSSRPGSGSEHMFSHALDSIAEKPALHGEQCAVGSILMAFLHDLDWEKIKSTMEKIGLKTKARDLDIKDDEIIKALEIAHSIRPERYTILGKDGLSHEVAVRVAEKTGVID
ncbi:MAG: NAD(P)-dependent glycerol-1-phosphate dehydrogenase [Candidatus Heimdallarchaeota archaeon]|nr:NAD(P)-dependent glycerol-1-phosphate dehydrogenase [Candidatus Heimdallarchaeota archaeon]MCK4953811.1 NAD(P)-dependent glycerol-1-phosphate dehydrogenase [Candidatus Heimdallarchaeota archaeon]